MMFNQSYQRLSLPDTSTVIYIEQANYGEKSLLIDFIDKHSFVNFIERSGLNLDSEGPSMIRIHNYIGKRVQEDTYYLLNAESIKKVFTPQTVIVREDSSIIAFEVDLRSSDVLLFDKSISPKLLGKYETVASKDFKLPENFFEGSGKGSSITVNVRDIGQGNWNEISINGINRIVFDIGTCKTASTAVLAKHMSTRDIIYQKDKPILILSHWDVDHYHCLLAAQDTTIAAFKYFIFRNIIPNQTAIRVYNKFVNHNPTALFPISSFDPSPKRSSTKLISYHLCLTGNYLLFNSYYNKNRNKNALGLLIRRRNSSVIFSGDYDYRQVSNHMLDAIYSPNENYLVVPHHGGNAGNYIYKVKGKVKLKSAFVSVGAGNTYNPKHPHLKNINSLIRSGFKVKRTDILGRDLSFTVK